MSKLWFSLYDNSAYTDNEIAFPDLTSYKGIEELEKNYAVIYNELTEYLKLFKLEPHFNNTLVEIPKTWKVRSLRVWGVEMYEIQKYFPETIRLLANIPHVVNVGFNLLEPHSKIKPHSGDTNAIYRCHLGLKVPIDYMQCVMKVKGQEQHWRQGKLLSFIDAYEHEARNNSNEERIILLVDILKPEFLAKKNKICATVISSFYAQQIGNYWSGIYNVKRSKFRYILFPFITILQFMIPIRNWIKK